MAKYSDCLQSEYLHPRETDSLPPFDQEATTSIPSCHCRPGYRARRVRSKGAILVIIWNLLVLACVTSVRFSVYSKITSIGGYNSVFLVFSGWLPDV